MRYLIGALEPWNFMTFHSVGNNHHPNWRTHSMIFQRGRYKWWPDYEILLCTCISINIIVWYTWAITPKPARIGCRQWFELDHAQLQSSLATLQRAIQSPVVFCGRPRGQKVGKVILLDTSCVHGMHPKTRRFLHHDHKMVPGSLSCWILRESARHIQRFLEMSGEDWMILNVWCSIAHRIHVWYIC